MVSLAVVGDAPHGTVFSIDVECSAVDDPPGGPPQVGASVVDQTVTFDATGNPPDVVVAVPAVEDRDDGFVLCGLNQDVATRAAILTPPTVVFSAPGTSRAADPQNDPVIGGPSGISAGVEFPYTRTGAVVHVTFTETYAAPPPPLVVLPPTFTG